MRPRASRRVLILIALTLVLARTLVVSLPAPQAPQVSPALFAEMRWRNIGPYRAGRTQAAGYPSQLAGVMNSLQGADVRPTTVQLTAITRARAVAARAMATWATVKTVDLPAMNAKITRAGLSALTVRGTSREK